MLLGEQALETGKEVLSRRRELSESGLSTTQQHAETAQWLTGELGFDLSGNVDWLINGEPDWFSVSRTLNLQNFSNSSQNERSVEPQPTDMHMRMTMR